MNTKPCPDCGVQVGENHAKNCDVPRCRVCGFQRLSCRLDGKHLTAKPVAWTGRWPGEVECEEFGLWSKWVLGKGWIECSPDDPAAGPDVNTLGAMGARGELKWTGERWVKP